MRTRKKNTLMAKTMLISLLLSLMAGFFGVSAQAAEDVTQYISFTGLTLQVSKSDGHVDYASFTYNSTTQKFEINGAPSVNILPGNDIILMVHWEVPTANMQALKNAVAGGGATFEIKIEALNDLYFNFPDCNALELVDGTPGHSGEVLGNWQVKNLAIKGSFNSNINTRSFLEKGYFTLSGAATKEGTDANFKINGSATEGITVTPPGPTTNYGPLGNSFTPLEKSGWMNQGSPGKIMWTVNVNQDSLAAFFKSTTNPPGDTLAAMQNVVLEDTLLGGQTITVGDIGISMPLYVPYYTGSSARDWELSNIILGYPSAKGFFSTEVDGTTYSDYDAFKADVIAKAPALGVFGGNRVVIAFGNLNDGTQASLPPPNNLSAKAIVDANGGIEALINGNASLAALDQSVRDAVLPKVRAAYSSDGTNGIHDGAMFLRVTLLADATNVLSGTLDNTASMTYNGNTTESSTKQLQYTNLAGGVQSGRLGQLTLQKSDAANGGPLQGVGFQLQRLENGSFVPYGGTGYTDSAGTVRFTQLEDGHYKVVETSPLQGYDGASAVYSPGDEFTINHAANEIHISLTATNQRIPAPQTGDAAGLAPWGTAALLAGCGLALCAVRLAGRAGRRQN